jgi:hypothetical protein
MERVEHLKDRFLNVILNGNSGAESAAVFVGVKNDSDEFTLVTLAQRARDLTHHLDVENVQGWPRESDARDAIFDRETDILVCGCHLLY